MIWNTVFDHLNTNLEKDYLKSWVASVLQTPEKKTSYLYFNGPENSGKSTFAYCLSLLLGPKVKLLSCAFGSIFNNYLEDMIVGVIEEMDLRDNRKAAKVLDILDSEAFRINKQLCYPYILSNHTHLVQIEGFPIEHKSLVRVEVPALKNEIPKNKLYPMLEKEKQDFLRSL